MRDMDTSSILENATNLHKVARAAERGAGGQLAPGPQPQGAPSLRNSLKLSKAPSESGQM